MTHRVYSALIGIALSGILGFGASPAVKAELSPPNPPHHDSSTLDPPALNPDLPLRKYVVDSWGMDDGLPSPIIEAIVQTRDGYLWLGTRGGLARFDGVRFTIFDRGRVPGFFSNRVSALLESRDGSLWAGFSQGGLHRLRDSRWDHFSTEDGLRNHSITTLHETADGDLWVGTPRGVDVFRDGRWVPLDGCLVEDVESLAETTDASQWIVTRKALWRYRDGSCLTWPGPDQVDTLSLDKPAPWNVLLAAHDDSLWLVAHAPTRLINLTGSAQTTVTAHKVASLSATQLLEDRRGTVWMGSFEGLVRFANGVSTVFSDSDGLADKRVLSLAEDREGSLWIGTYNGLNRLKTSRFETLTEDDGLSSAKVFSILKGSDGGIWIGTESGVDHFSEGTLKTLPTAGKRPLNKALSLLEDARGVLWVGTFEGLFRLQNGILEPYEPHGMEELASTRVRAIHKTRGGDLWIGSTTGATRLNQESPSSSETLSLDGETAQTIHEDRQGSLWFGTRFALFQLRDSLLTRYPPLGDSGNYYVRAIREDPSGVMWLGTLDNGLLRFEDGRFTEFNTSHGLHDDHVWHSLEDAANNFWMCSDRGLFTAPRRQLEALARGERDSISGNAYGLSDGLKSLECNGVGQPLGLKTGDGRLWFLTAGGVVIVDPARLKLNLVAPTVIVEEVEVDGVEVRNTIGRHPDPVVMPTGARQLEIRFTATSLRDPSRVRFSYLLENYDDDWTPASSRRWAVYGNLPPGSYQFRVKASNNDNPWSEQTASLEILVPQPAWRSGWAFTLYGLALATAAMVYVHAQRVKLRRERAVSQRLREIDRLKDDFLANTSHELRTPLHGITGLVESLIEGSRGDLPADAKADLSMAAASAHRLSHLVSDILDFSKLQHQSLKLKKRPVDVRALAEVVLTLSRPLVGAKDLELLNTVPQDLPDADADEDRLQQILYNLVGNGIKFTETGQVEVSAEADGEQLLVRVSDTGVGIAAEKQGKIFGAFEQADTSVRREHGGTGLGLAVTRQLVELHGGQIGVESKLGQGSSFFFSLPAVEKDAATKKDAVAEKDAETTIIAAEQSSPPRLAMDTAKTMRTDQATESPTARILVVDDEPVNLLILRNYLSLERFELILAGNGPEALALLEKESVDLILLDVMMPKMSGYEVCRIIRQTHPIEKLPILFLSAMERSSDRVAGLEEGANDYLTKPIARGELLSRVTTHLALLDAHRRQEEEVVSLRGLLPICASCKKIRDDEGYWNQMEIYISQRSEAEFSHGICPTCALKLYPGLYKPEDHE